MLLALLLGCSGEPDSPSISNTSPSDSGTATSQQGGESATPKAHETWEAVFINGTQAGYMHTTEEPQQVNGEKEVKVNFEFRMFVDRFGDKSAPSMAFTSWEKPSGELLRFESSVVLGPTPMTTHGEVQGDKLVVERKSLGKTETSEIAWSPDIKGFYAMEQSVRNRPLQPGEQRTFQSLHPVFNQVANVTLTAKDFETVQLLDGSERLLRVENTMTVPGTPEVATTLWVNAEGIPLKTRTTAMLPQETYRTTKEVATSQPKGPALDIGFATTVPVANMPPDIHARKQATYRVRIKNGDPTKTFSHGPTQQVKKIDEHTAEITVKAIQPSGQVSVGPAKIDPGDLAPNNLIQSDDPTIVAMAQQAAGGKTDPWQQAQASEKFVHDTIQNKNFSQAFATAAEVAKSKEGDCTEHAVLLAALARALNIPARVAIGLVYSPSAGGFAFHMWDEVLIGDTWIPIDGTLARGGVGAGHLKLADSNLKGAIGLASFLPVAQVMGQLEIELVRAE